MEPKHKFTTVVAIALLLICSTGFAAEGFYQFSGFGWSLNRSVDRSSFAADAGLWTETVGNSITVAPFSFQRNAKEENYSLGILQASMFFDRIVIGLGIGDSFKDDKDDAETPEHYFTSRIFTTVFLSSLADGWKGKWGVGAVFDYTPATSDVLFSVGTVVLF